MSRILEYTLHDSIAIVSVHCSEDKETYLERGKALSDDLYLIGYDYMNIDGQYTHEDSSVGSEKSCFVFKKSGYNYLEFVQDMEALSQKYELKSIIDSQ